MIPPREQRLREYPVVPLEYAGLWIAWDRDQTRIVASARTLNAAYEAAIAAGEPRPVLGKAPDADRWFVTGTTGPLLPRLFP